MDVKTRFFIGCLGALSPILLNLLAFDISLILQQSTPLTVISYIIRQLALCAAACIVIYLCPDAKKPLTIFQLGVAAPAFLIGLINGVSQSQNVRLPSRASIQMPAIVGSAYAQPAPSSASSPPTGEQVPVSDCSMRGSTPVQQIIRGTLGILPEDRWFVVTSSNLQLQTAIDDVQDIKRRYAGKFQPKICAPIRGDNRYRVVIGENLTYEAASKLRDEAIAAGLSRDSWLWSPLQALFGG